MRDSVLCGYYIWIKNIQNIFVICYHHTNCEVFIWLLLRKCSSNLSVSCYIGIIVIATKFASIKIYFQLKIHDFIMISGGENCQLIHSNLFLLNLKKFMTPFLWMEFDCFKAAVPLQGNSLLFITKVPMDPVAHLIDLWRMKGWVTQWFWAWDPRIGNPAPYPQGQFSIMKSNFGDSCLSVSSVFCFSYNSNL